jgi:hypothetical protein
MAAANHTETVLMALQQPSTVLECLCGRKGRLYTVRCALPSYACGLPSYACVRDVPKRESSHTPDPAAAVGGRAGRGWLTLAIAIG